MIRSQDMCKATLFAPTKAREQVITSLHKHGLLQLSETKVDLPTPPPDEEARTVSDLLLRVSRLATILKMPPRSLTWQQKFFGYEIMGKQARKRARHADIHEEAKTFLDAHESKLLSLEKQHTQATENIGLAKDRKQVLEKLAAHGIPATMLSSTSRIGFLVGELSPVNGRKLQSELKQQFASRVITELFMVNKKQVLFAAIVLKQDMHSALFITKKHGLSQFAFNIPDNVNALEWVEEVIRRNEKDAQDALNELAKQQHLLDDAVHLREELEIVKERTDALHFIRQSNAFFALQGWVLAEEKATLQRAVPDAYIVLEQPVEDEEPPVQPSNPTWLRPFEMLTELYSLPKYKDLDPTFIVAPLFLLYAGFMLTDFVYGFGLVLLGAIMYILFRKVPGGTRDISISIFLIGIFAMLFGVLTGSYLGDAPQYFFGIPTADLAIWEDPLANPMYFLIFSLIIGGAHLNIGLLLGALEDYRKNDWRTLLAERGTWWLLQVVVVAVILLQGAPTLLMLLPIIILLLWILYFHGLLGILGATGFMGDVISYSRLFALALSTAGIAMTVNLLANMLVDVPYVGFLLAALIFLAGHLFSFAMNALGSFVHSIRLQFVEFFGKFYEGGGERFQPFKEERVYTEARE